jgi:hypothetical protein
MATKKKAAKTLRTAKKIQSTKNLYHPLKPS